jgi:nicotinamide-nucleotide amidase
MTDMTGLAEKLGEVLLKQGRVLATAESCTGGWVAKLVTDIAGSSQWFDRGFVTYSNQAKQDMLGVPGAMLATEGAVSEATVAAMTAGALANSLADIVLAISGIAGPGGERPGKPVGTVCFAWQQRQHEPRVETRHFSGDRNSVRQAAVFYALQVLLDELDSD